VCNIALAVTVPEGAAADDLGAARFEAKRDGEGWLEDVRLSEVLEGFSKLVETARDPYVAVTFPETMPLGMVNRICTVLSSVETETGIRVEPPPAGQLYYRAFLPNEQFRARTKRYAQPRELILQAGADGEVAAELVTVTQTWHEDQLKPEVSSSSQPVKAPSDLAGMLGDNPRLPVLLVFAAPGVTHGTLMAYVAPVLATYPNVHVYLGLPE
jgi:hypothetical protein